MHPVHELIDTADPAFPLVREWAAEAGRPVEILPPSENREAALFQTQVTTRSTMGAVVYETGGILVEQGWLRILGSGHPKLTRTLPGWNDERLNGAYLIADDAVGGFFAINGGALGEEVKSVYYFAPDTLEWESLEFGYTDFLHWALTADLSDFYADLRWSGWERDVARLHGDEAFLTIPPLFTREGRLPSVERRKVPISESWSIQMDFREQLGPARAPGS